MLLLLGVLLMSGSVVSAQSGGGFEIRSSTVDGGGGSSNGGNFAVDGTMGQMDAGIHTGGNFTLNGGFWQGSTCEAPIAPNDFTIQVNGNDLVLNWSATNADSYRIYRKRALRYRHGNMKPFVNNRHRAWCRASRCPLSKD